MKPVVIDSSVTIKWINQIDEELVQQSDKILYDAQREMIRLLAPELSKYEIGNALLKKQLDLPFAYDSIGTMYQLPITFIPETEELARQTYAIAEQTGMTYYDASFVALAKHEQAILVTDNVKHQGKSVEIIVIPLKDY